MIPITGVTQAEVLVERIWPIRPIERIGADPERRAARGGPRTRRPASRPVRPFDPNRHHLDVFC